VVTFGAGLQLPSLAPLKRAATKIQVTEAATERKVRLLCGSFREFSEGFSDGGVK
jgi:hypothetical protein